MIQKTIYTEVNGTINATNISVCSDTDPVQQYVNWFKMSVPNFEIQARYQFIICTVVIGAVCCFGLIGNSLSFIVLRKDRSHSTTNFVLQVLAVWDTILLVECIFYLSLSPVFFHTNQLYDYFVLFPYILPYILPLAIMAQTIVNWLVVVVTVERYIVVCWPFRASVWCTLPKVKRAVFTIITLGILYNIPRFFEWTVVEYQDSCTNYTMASIKASPIRLNLAYKIVYRVLSYITFVAVGPMIILTVLNFKLIQTLRKATRERMQLARGAQTQTNNTTIIVVVVSVFIVCQTPALIHQIIEANDITSADSILGYTTPASNMLVTLNSSTNFFIYCLFGQKFRRILIRMLCKNRPIGARANVTNSMYSTAKFTTVTQISETPSPPKLKTNATSAGKGKSPKLEPKQNTLVNSNNTHHQSTQLDS